MNKLTLYAAMGIPEFWRFNGSILRVYALSDDRYTEVQTSPTFSRVAVKEIPRFIQEAKQNGENATTQAFRIWVRQQIIYYS